MNFKNLVHRLVQAYFFSSLHMGFFAVSIAFAASFLLQQTFDLTSYVIIFLLVFSLYNLNKRTDLLEDKINSVEKFNFQKKHGLILLCLGIFSMMFSLMLSFNLGIPSFVFTLLPLLFGIAYSVNVLPGFFKIRRFKNIVGIKNIYIALVLGYIHLILPIFLNNHDFNLAVLFVYLFLFLRMIINTIIFDIRDVEGDKYNDIKTIPICFGLVRTRFFLHIVNIFSFFILAVGVFANVLSSNALCFILLFIPSTFYINLNKGKFNELFHYEFLVDGSESYFLALLSLLCILILI